MTHKVDVEKVNVAAFSVDIEQCASSSRLRQRLQSQSDFFTVRVLLIVEVGELDEDRVARIPRCITKSKGCSSLNEKEN